MEIVRQQLGLIFGNMVEFFYGGDSAIGRTASWKLATGVLQVMGEFATLTGTPGVDSGCKF